MNPAGDVRDVIADSKRVADGEKGSWIKLGATVIGAVPVVGDGAKALIKTEERAIIKGLEKSAEKEIVEIGEKEVAKIAKEEAEKLAKTEAEQIAKRYDEIAKSGHPVPLQFITPFCPF